jgi:putative ABC transport system permease protein
MSSFALDLRYALRQMRRARGFTFAAVVTLALGIGANTAMFSVIRAVLLKPLAYRDPGRVMLLTHGATPVRFEELKADTRSYTELGAFAAVPEHLALSGIAEPEVLNGARVSGNFLDILALSPIRGRSFLPEEDRAGAPAVAMISRALWQRQFLGDPAIVGRTMTLAGVPHTIVGVLPAGFAFPFPGVDVWVTRPSELSSIDPQSRPLSPILRIFGRLKQQVGLAQANVELVVLKGRYAAAHPGMIDAKPNAPESWSPIRDEIVSDVHAKLWMLFGALGLVLLIVCANLGSLLLARATSRTREFAVRAAIGAGRARIVRQLLAESILLASIGGALGTALAFSGVRFIRNITFVDLPRAGEIRMDGIVLGFAIAVSLATGALFGLIPALVASKADLAMVLRGTSLGSGAVGSRKMARFGPHSLLVAGQVALSVVLLIGAALLIESLAHLYRVDPGFQPARLLTMKLSLPPARFDSDVKRTAFYEEVLERTVSLPGVGHAALSLTLPMTPWMGMPVQLAAGPRLKLNERPIAVVQLVSPDYFRTLEIALKRGREFTAHDNAASAPVAIINETLARRFWPQYPNGPDPVGQYLLAGANHPPKQIVGISTDAHDEGKDHDPMPAFYAPCAQGSTQSAALIVRTDGDPSLLASAVRKQVLGMEPDLAVSDVTTMDEVVEASEVQLRLMMRLLAAFSGVATLLALGGLYSVISYAVAARTKEIGIRRALGAPHGEIIALVAAQGLALSLAGALLGIGAALALTRALKGLLFEVRPTDPATFIGVAMLFVLIALAATYLPARRAARVDPMVALRYE